MTRFSSADRQEAISCWAVTFRAVMAMAAFLALVALFSDDQGKVDSVSDSSVRLIVPGAPSD